jgi:hypothetical protein
MKKERFDAKINRLIDRIVPYLRGEYGRLFASGGMIYKRPPRRFRWKIPLNRGCRRINRTNG